MAQWRWQQQQQQQEEQVEEVEEEEEEGGVGGVGKRRGRLKRASPAGTSRFAHSAKATWRRAGCGSTTLVQGPVVTRGTRGCNVWVGRSGWAGWAGWAGSRAWRDRDRESCSSERGERSDTVR